MSKDLNLCQFIGRLGGDPEVKYSNSGKAITNLNLACGDDYKDKNTGQKVEQTNWIRVVAFGRTAEVMGEYLKKGSQVYVSGKQVTRKWQDQQGQDRYTTEVVADQMQMLDSRGSDTASGGGGAGRSQSNQNAGGGQQAPQPTTDFDDSDDIPF